MDRLKVFGGKKKNIKPAPYPVERPIKPQDDLEAPEMEKLLDSFMRTSWKA